MRRASVLVAVLWPGPARAQDPIFDQNRLHEVRIVIDPADWKALRDNFLSNQYYSANISIDGEVVEQVGIRSRGSGSRSGQKPGLKVDFNKYVKGQEFHGYKSVVLDNLTQDESLLRERMAYSVFEAMGIAAPQNAHARLTVNDEYWGVYGIVESVTKPFLRARFADDGGNLFDYEYNGSYDFSFRGDDPGLYIPKPFEPDTNEDDVDGSGLVAFIKAINQLPDEGFVTGISAYLDVDKFLTYLATENAIAESDGFVGSFGTNNFFLYQFAGQNRFVFIPWDKDTSFSNPTWPLYQRLETNVLTRRLTADPAKRQVYAEAVKRAVTSFVNARWLLPRMEQAYTQIREAVLTDTKKPYTNDAFELSVVGLRGIISSREADVQAQAP
jgi:spore coat protein CotH